MRTEHFSRLALHRHLEPHRLSRVAWLRAAVLGANDGIISTSSLMIGVAGATVNLHAVIMTGVAGLVAGAMSMAAGEYVSVSSQADVEQTAIAQERHELDNDYEHEVHELAAIYTTRGLTPALAREVAQALMNHDALAAHTRDELGISDDNGARPLTAAVASALSFGCGALLPLAVALIVRSLSDAASPAMWHSFALTSAHTSVVSILLATVVALAALGAVAAKAGGAQVLPSALRVTGWGTLAIAVSYGIGTWFSHLGQIG